MRHRSQHETRPPRRLAHCARLDAHLQSTANNQRKFHNIFVFQNRPGAPAARRSPPPALTVAPATDASPTNRCCCKNIDSFEFPTHLLHANLPLQLRLGHQRRHGVDGHHADALAADKVVRDVERHLAVVRLAHLQTRKSISPGWIEKSAKVGVRYSQSGRSATCLNQEASTPATGYIK